MFIKLMPAVQFAVNCRINPTLIIDFGGLKMIYFFVLSMKIEFSFILFLFLLLTLLGFYGSFIYGRKTKKFRWSEYIALLIIPILCSFSLIYLFGIKIIWLFIASSIIGFMLEYILGLAYHKTLNRRLREYDVSSLGGYTSWLALPIWGAAGVLFWMVSKTIGL